MAVTPAQKLDAMWAYNNRFKNFGPALSSVHISGFRGINGLSITFESPITAFSGTNGSGKSTIVQLLACAYRPLKTAKKKRYYVKDFFTLGILDPAPYEPKAAVQYRYASHIAYSNRTVTVARATSEWSGYKRQPERKSHYVGFTLYIPKVERKDFSVLHSQNLQMSGLRQPAAEVLEWTKRILGNQYDDVDFPTVKHQGKEAEVGRLERHGARYSENNMGFGEGRVLYLVDLLENSPPNSLFVLEEPETSLHPQAQYALGQYLIDVTLRNKHQIFLSTHSESLLSGLPPKSRKFLVRDAGDIDVIDGVSITQASCFLSGFQKPALTVLVEDPETAAVLTEIVRVNDQGLLDQVTIHETGDKAAVAKSLAVLRKHGRNSIAFRDADVGENPVEGLYSLPGNTPPEKELINCKQVQDHLRKQYHFDVPAFLKYNPKLDHHKYFPLIAAKARIAADILTTECARVYAQSLPDDMRKALVKKIRDSL